MNLVIDQGNSVCKLGVFDNGKLLMSTSVDRLDLYTIEGLLDRYKSINSVLYSSVGKADGGTEALRLLEPWGLNMIVLSEETPTPLRVNYRRDTLGSDRLAVAVGANKLTELGTSALVIDAGTAITYEYLSADGTYLGGNISPGIALRFKALHAFTKRLPLIERTPEWSVDGYGSDTEMALVSGVMRGLVYEVRGYIEQLRLRGEKYCVWLTGGDAPELLKYIEEAAVSHIPELVLIGLNEILEYNKTIQTQ